MQYIDRFLDCKDAKERMAVVSEMKSERKFFPIHLARDLLCLNLDDHEKIAILDISSTQDLLGFEQFLTEGSVHWEQNLAAFAMRKWLESTDHLLWYRILANLKLPHLSQRMKYTILDLCPLMPGKELLQQIANSEGLDDLSPAFHGLLICRCLQWNLFYPQVDKIAATAFSDLEKNLWPDHKALIPSLSWMVKYHSKKVEKSILNSQTPAIWRDHLHLLLNSHSWPKSEAKKLDKICQEYKQVNFWSKFSKVWPCLWQRPALMQKSITLALEAVHTNLKTSTIDQANIWEFFAGIDQELLLTSVIEIVDPIAYSSSLNTLKSLLPFPIDQRLIEKAKEHLQNMASPQNLLSSVPMRFRIALHEGHTSEPSQSWLRISNVLREESESIKQGYPNSSRFFDFSLRNHPTLESSNQSDAERKIFFDLSYRVKNAQASEKDPESFWSVLTHTWLKPNIENLDSLTSLARQQSRIYQLCYIRTLGRFKFQDQACLKLLDYIRTNNPNELEVVIESFGAIASPRALQELVSAMTRPNMTNSLQIKICEILKEHDLSSIQRELRSALEDLSTEKHTSDDLDDREVCESLGALITADRHEPDAPQQIVPSPMSGAALDRSLTERIAEYQQLSSEVRRALRTAQFFYDQVLTGGTSHTIDLSPVIDMQYKALELLFRETFEDVCFQLISDGSLQRKLDIIGYSRPIPRAMDQFESYIGQLPTIKDIPYFSKFKLRKMLRAICQFRPGRRFTLDGIKAFSLFFLCFGRNSCQYGLQGILPVSFKSDPDLFEFCRLLHIFQDFRNRAAHEGFRPEARNDMEGIWSHTAVIIKTAFELAGANHREAGEDLSSA